MSISNHTKADNHCPYCLVEIDRTDVVQTLCCKHEFHATCLGEGISQGIKLCGVCRAVIAFHTDYFRETPHDSCEPIDLIRKVKKQLIQKIAKFLLSDVSFFFLMTTFVNPTSGKYNWVEFSALEKPDQKNVINILKYEIKNSNFSAKKLKEILTQLKITSQ